MTDNKDNGELAAQNTHDMTHKMANNESANVNLNTLSKQVQALIKDKKLYHTINLDNYSDLQQQSQLEQPNSITTYGTDHYRRQSNVRLNDAIVPASLDEQDNLISQGIIAGKVNGQDSYYKERYIAYMQKCAVLQDEILTLKETIKFYKDKHKKLYEELLRIFNDGNDLEVK